MQLKHRDGTKGTDNTFIRTASIFSRGMCLLLPGEKEATKQKAWSTLQGRKTNSSGSSGRERKRNYSRLFGKRDVGQG